MYDCCPSSAAIRGAEIAGEGRDRTSKRKAPVSRNVGGKFVFEVKHRQSHVEDAEQ